MDRRPRKRSQEEDRSMALEANDRHQPWWNMGWAFDFVPGPGQPRTSSNLGSMAYTANGPQVYADYAVSQYTVATAQSLASGRWPF